MYYMFRLRVRTFLSKLQHAFNLPCSQKYKYHIFKSFKSLKLTQYISKISKSDGHAKVWWSWLSTMVQLLKTIHAKVWWSLIPKSDGLHIFANNAKVWHPTFTGQTIDVWCRASDFGMTIRLQSPIIFLLLHIFKGFTGKQFYLKSPSNFANITFYMLFLKSAMKATSHHFISDKECMWLLCKSF